MANFPIFKYPWYIITNLLQKKHMVSFVFFPDEWYPDPPIYEWPPESPVLPLLWMLCFWFGVRHWKFVSKNEMLDLSNEKALRVLCKQRYLGNPFIRFNLKYSINYFHHGHVTLLPLIATVLKPSCQFSVYLNREIQDPKTTRFLVNEQQRKKKEIVVLYYCFTWKGHSTTHPRQRLWAADSFKCSQNFNTCWMLPCVPRPTRWLASLWYTARFSTNDICDICHRKKELSRVNRPTEPTGRPVVL